MERFRLLLRGVEAREKSGCCVDADTDDDDNGIVEKPGATSGDCRLMRIDDTLVERLGEYGSQLS